MLILCSRSASALHSKDAIVGATVGKILYNVPYKEILGNVMSEIAPDAAAQTDQQNNKVNRSLYGLYIRLPDWVRLTAKACLGLWIINFFIGIAPIANRGTFGDTFGAANSLFSAFALLGVAWSVSMQREELRITRDDRRDTQENLKQTKELLKIQENNIKAQNDATQKQMFEATFFQMFSAFNSVASDVEVTYEVSSTSSTLIKLETIKGRAAFEKLVSILSNKFKSDILYYEVEGNFIGGANKVDMNLRIAKAAFSRSYGYFFSEHGDDLGRYFRTLYTIMKFVQKSTIEDEDKKLYIKFIRAQLSMHEATLLVANYLSPHTRKPFNTLCEHYGMAKNADRNNVIIELLSNLIPIELYGSTEVASWIDPIYEQHIMEQEGRVYLYDNDESDGN